ncbi:hypothetical protein GQR58_003572 [Nymphon striatum]|nr:hypothetical protein GQR58_003572 [Nymphon striatum]
MCQACVKRASEQRDFLPSYQRDGQGREEEDFGGERSGYRGGRRPRSISRKGRDCRVVIALEGHCFGIPVLVMPELGNLGVDCLLGGDVIDHVGGVTVRRDPHLKYVVSWGNPRPTSCCGMSSDGHVQAALASGVAGKSVSRSQRAPAPLRIDDSDFVADFADGRWVVSWRWSRELPKTLQTRIGEYKCTQAPHVRERYNAEIQRWISKGWLKEWRGPIEGIIPLLAVFQPSKDKVRPVMDYRELNDFVECHTGDVIAVCGEKIREWRQLRGELKIVDLKSAYLQIHISENLWKYQVVNFFFFCWV